MKTVDERHIIRVCLFCVQNCVMCRWKSPEPASGDIAQNRKEKVIGYDREDERYENKRNDRSVMVEMEKSDKAKEKKV